MLFRLRSRSRHVTSRNATSPRMRSAVWGGCFRGEWGNRLGLRPASVARGRGSQALRTEGALSSFLSRRGR